MTGGLSFETKSSLVLGPYPTALSGTAFLCEYSSSSSSQHDVERLDLESGLRKVVPMSDCLTVKIHQNVLMPLKTQLNENYFLRSLKRGNDKI